MFLSFEESQKFNGARLSLRTKHQEQGVMNFFADLKDSWDYFHERMRKLDKSDIDGLANYIYEDFWFHHSLKRIGIDPKNKKQM